MQAADQGSAFVQPAGALRVLARRDDGEILIVHGEERPVGPGERLAHVEWFPSIAVARAVSHFCSARLLMIDRRPDADGWHAFGAAHVRTLVADARTHLNVTFFPPAPKPPPLERQDWTRERIARLGYLIGIGWTAKKIAGDGLIRSTENNVYRQAHKLGLYLSAAPQNLLAVRLPRETRGVLESAAATAGIRCDLLARRILVREAARGAERIAADVEG